MEKLFTILAAVAIGIAGLLFISFLLSWPVYMLWNGCFVGAIAGVQEIKVARDDKDILAALKKLN